MPATAAIDNETLDHLLSVVTDKTEHIGRRRRFGRAKPSFGTTSTVDVY
jgi:hypothetical protein